MRNIIVTVDRIEGNYAVLITDDGISFSFPTSLFDAFPSEGDMFELTLTPRPDQKEERVSRITSLFEKLKNKGESQI